MGNQLSVAAKKINDHPHKCLEVNIDVRRGSPERFFLIPVTPTTMPTPQSPLCAMLNEALSAPSAVHWAWPPVWSVETPCSGVADERLDLRASRATPTAEETFAHALPLQVTSYQDKVEDRAGSVELGHLLSFVAVECPVDCPNRRVSRPPRHQDDRAAPPGQEEGGSIFFDFSADWLESISQTEGCAVVGYFRYLNLFDLPKLGKSCANVTATTDEASNVPIVSVIDHYLFKGFCYEARAFMLLEAVSFYCKRFTKLYGYAQRPSGCPRQAGEWRLPGACRSVLMRCRSPNLPIVRLFQKLFRAYAKECSREKRIGGAHDEHPATDDQTEGSQHLSLPCMRVTECADGEVIHLRLCPNLVHHIAGKLCDKVLSRKKAAQLTCLVRFARGLMEPTPTPFDALIDRHRQRWLAENAPFRKHADKSVPYCHGEEGDLECPGGARLAHPAPTSRESAGTEKNLSQLTFYDTSVRGEREHGISIGPLSVGQASEILPSHLEHGLGSVVTSLTPSDSEAFVKADRRAFPVAVHSEFFRSPYSLRYLAPIAAAYPPAARGVPSDRGNAFSGAADHPQDQTPPNEKVVCNGNRVERGDSASATPSAARLTKHPSPLPTKAINMNCHVQQPAYILGQPTDYHQEAFSFGTLPEQLNSPSSSITSPLTALTGFPRLQPLPVASGSQEREPSKKHAVSETGNHMLLLTKESNPNVREVVSGPVQRLVKDYVGHPIFIADCRPQWISRQRSDTGFLQIGTPVQVNNGDGQWICGYWIEPSRQLTLHWFDPARSENALLLHPGQIWIRDLAGENRLITSTSTSGKVYVAVAPYVQVFPSPHLEGGSVEVRALFDRSATF
jgi:hypothetical protein